MAEWICETCVYDPPSACDGKPCCMCDPNDPMLNCYQSVSYTHLDVYKRQEQYLPRLRYLAWCLKRGRFPSESDLS